MTGTPASLRLDSLRSPWTRVAAAGGGLAALAGALWIADPMWPVWVALVAPDLAGLAGIARGLAPKQMHPRGVPWYNAAHRLPGPVVTIAAGLVLGAPLVTAIGLAWLATLLIDRAAGYTLRGPDGLRR